MTGTRIPWHLISRDLLTRYSATAPRYTSYPTAPEWSDEFGTQDHAAALDAADKRPEAPLSIYVHAPYCRTRCLYCGCASWVSNSTDAHDVYLDAIQGEVSKIAVHVRNRRAVKQLHWGGGTPTTFDPERLTRLFHIITEHFTLDTGAEIAIEVDPVVTTKAHVDTLRRLGFNRISMGVQDFTHEVQEAVGRIQGEDITRELFENARSAGFTGINFDLIYGLPRQQLDTWRQNIETVIDIKPDRLAVFGYAHVPWMRPHQKAIREQDLPDTDMRFKLAKIAHDMLVDAGYVNIGMDHFALPTDELAVALQERRLWRNFQGYTVLEAPDLIGIGVTAISDLRGSFAQNNPGLEAYIQSAKKSELATYRGKASSEDDRIRRHVITHLMCNLSLDVCKIEDQFHIDFWSYFSEEKKQLAVLAKDGLIETDPSAIRVTPIGRLFVRHVGMAFDRYVRERKADGPRFSKTV